MAGMFYSLQEAAEKLKKTQEELKRLVKQGKLREFRDGPHLLFKMDEVEALMADTSIMTLKETPAPEIPELELPEMETPEEIKAPEPVTPEVETPEMEVPAQAEQPADTEEILLAPETGAPAPPGELTEEDTALAGEGINILGETDRGYHLTDDTMAETTGTIGPTGTVGTTGTTGTPEPSLEEIEEDVSMDTFGSGSGLLDLSLQADDTSLGAILDEIYTPEGVESKEPAAAKSGPPEEAEQLEAPAEFAGGELPEEALVGPQPVPEAIAIAPAYVEPEPDVQSNTLGMLLFLPLVLFLYTAVVAVAGLKGVVPSILAQIQGAIWYIMIGAVVVTGVVAGAAFMINRPSAPGGTARKEKKPKLPKKSKKAKEAPPSAPEETAV